MSTKDHLFVDIYILFSKPLSETRLNQSDCHTSETDACSGRQATIVNSWFIYMM